MALIQESSDLGSCCDLWNFIHFLNKLLLIISNEITRLLHRPGMRKIIMYTNKIRLITVTFY